MTTTELTDRVAEHVQDFLRAEQAASDLVDQLEHLRAETEHYRTARTALDQVAQGVAGSASTLGDLSNRVTQVIETLRTIGTPELRAGQEQLAGSVDALATNVGSLDDSVARQVTTVVESLEALRTELVRTREQQAGQQQALADLQTRLDQKLLDQVQAQQLTSEAVGRVEVSLRAAVTDVQRQRRFTTVWFVVLLLAVVLVGVLPLLLRR